MATNVQPQPYSKRAVPTSAGLLSSWLITELGNIQRALPNNWAWPPLAGEVGVKDLKYYYGDVRRYGVVMGASTDQTALMANAVDSVSALGGGVVSVPAGTVLCNTVLLPTLVTLAGAGRGVTTIKKTGSEAAALIFFVRPMGDYAGVRDCTVEGLGSSGHFGYCIAITNSAKYCRIENVECKNYHIGIGAGGVQSDPTRRWDDCSYNVVLNCDLHDFDDAASAFFAPTAAYGNVVAFTRTADSSGGSGNEFRNQIQSRYVGCDADSLQNSFRFEEASVGCVAVGCTSRNAVQRGFLALASVSTTGASGETHDCQFVGCTSIDDEVGFEVQNADRTSMIGCTATASTTFGFIVHGNAGPTSLGDDFVIDGCIADGCGVDGFRVEPGYGARGRISGTARSNTAAGVRVRAAAGQTGTIDATSTGNTTNYQIEDASWAVRPPANTVTLLNGGGVNVQPDATAGNFQRIRVTNATAFQVNNPSNPNANGLLAISVENAAGGAMGAITWDTSYKLAGAFTNPATGNLREITFRYDTAGGVWRETSRTTADQAV